MITPDGAVGFNCYNCGFKFRFEGQSISTAFEQFLTWLGVERSQIQAVKMELFRAQVDGEETYASTFNRWRSRWDSVELPAGSEPIETALENHASSEDFVNAINYLQTRGSAIVGGYDYYWCPGRQHQMSNRIIIPFYYRGQIVGYTARLAGRPDPGTPKYYNSAIPDGYLFNADAAEIPGRRFLVVTEGPFDAIAVQGVAAMGATLSDNQIHWLSQQDREIVVLPDRERKNQTLIDTAQLFGWAVSFPEWDEDIKDGADACARYGQIYTITSVLRAQTTNPVEIGVKRQMFKG